MLKKSLIKCTSLLLTAALFTGCGSNASNPSETDGSDNTTAEAGSSDVLTAESGEAEEITVMIWDRGSAAAGTTNEDNALTQWIQEQVLKECNVKVSFMAVPRSGSDDKLNIMMSGGTAPDIVFSYDQSLFGNYASNGGLADLTDALAGYGSNITENIGNIQYMGQSDGKQFAVMKRRGIQIPRHISYIRKDWLDTLDMGVPTTKEELIACLRAFKEKNPGNVSGVIPWAMGGTADTEKFYLNFVCSYVPALSEEDAYVYSETFKVFAEGAVDGLKELNTLYNEGLITRDFATDTTNDIYKQDVCAGNAGFVLDDSTNLFDYIPVLKTNVSGAEFVPLNTFDTPEGNYCNPTEPLYGMFIMVPAVSSEKVNACMKYLNWQADPANAENVAYTPEHTRNDAGVPINLTEDQLHAAGYPGNSGDYNIVNDHFEFTDSKEGVVSQWSTANEWETKEWFEGLYDVITTDQYLFPTYPVVLESEATYAANLRDMAIEYVYKLISCEPGQFDELQASEYKKLVTAGLEKILEERRVYYKENAAN